MVVALLPLLRSLLVGSLMGGLCLILQIGPTLSVPGGLVGLLSEFSVLHFL